MKRATSLAVFLTRGMAAAAVASACAIPAHAADWTLLPRASFLPTYTDNPRLVNEGSEANAGAALLLASTLTGAGELWNFRTTPRLRFSRYADDDGLLDSEEQYLDTDFERRLERGAVALSANFSRDTTLTSELGSTGIVQANRPHRGIVLNARGNLVATEHLTLGATAGWQDQHYDNGQLTGLNDYRYATVGTFGGLALSPHTVLKLTVQGGELMRANNSVNTRNASAQLRLEHDLSEKWTFGISAGPSVIDTGFRKDYGALYSMDATHTGERWTWNASLGRDVSPTGLGLLSRRDELLIGTTYRAQEFLNFGLSVRGVENRDIFDFPGFPERKLRYFSADVRMDWRFAERWTLGGIYAAALQKYQGLPGEAHNNRVQVEIAWAGKALQL